MRNGFSYQGDLMREPCGIHPIAAGLELDDDAQGRLQRIAESRGSGTRIGDEE